MKIAIFMRGPGEVSQGYALGQYFKHKGDEVYFILKEQINQSFFSDDTSSNILVLPGPKDSLIVQFIEIINTIKPDTVILCNSKCFSKPFFLIESPWPNIPVFTLDSNWLFNKKYKYLQYVTWAKKYFINIPKPVFDYGLTQNGGDFEIESKAMGKMQVVGLIPSYSKIDNETIMQWRGKNNCENDKVIFCYVSGQGAGSKYWVLENLLKTVEYLIKMGKKIKIFIAGYVENPQTLPSYCSYLNPNLGMEGFYTALSSSDLVFQHQGLATLEQAICAQIPVIANVTSYPLESIPKIHIYELEPFKKAGICALLQKDTDQKEIYNTVNTLLYDENARKKMIEKQKKLYNHGEAEVYTTISRIVKNNV